jgi:hypothetical protein
MLTIQEIKSFIDNDAASMKKKHAKIGQWLTDILTIYQ